MEDWIWILLTLALTGCAGLSLEQPARPGEAGSQTDQSPDDVVAYHLDDYGAAPEWQNDIWLNTEEPLRLRELRGKVVLLDMWTYG